jgi:hypothetical protein
MISTFSSLWRSHMSARASDKKNSMVHIDSTLLTVLIIMSLGVIIGGLGLVWKLAAPTETPPEAPKKKIKTSGKEKVNGIDHFSYAQGCRQQERFIK